MYYIQKTNNYVDQLVQEFLTYNNNKNTFNLSLMVTMLDHSLHYNQTPAYGVM